MKKFSIFYISYYFPPIHSIASLRNYNLTRYLSKKVGELTVLTTRNQGIFPKDEKSLEGIVVNQLPTFDYRTISHLFKKNANQIHYDESTKSNPLIKFLIRLNETLPFSLLFGEGGLIFILTGVRKVLSYYKRDDTTTILITPFRPAANVIVGYIVKRLRPDTIWVAGMHDIPINYKRPNCYLPNLQRKIWSHLLSKTNKVITISDGLARDLHNYKVSAEVVESGIIPRNPDSAKNSKFTISFTGSLYDKMIYPIDLFESVERLLKAQKIDHQKIRIVYAGKDALKWKQYCGNFPLTNALLKCFEVLPHGEALKLQTLSNINLLLTWNVKEVNGILTGKLFEYLGARNPILTIVNGTLDPDLESIFKRFQCGQIIYTSDEHKTKKTEDFISTKYQSWLAGNYSKMYNPKEPLLDQSWEKQALKYWNLINS